MRKPTKPPPQQPVTPELEYKDGSDATKRLLRYFLERQNAELDQLLHDASRVEGCDPREGWQYDLSTDRWVRPKPPAKP